MKPGPIAGALLVAAIGGLPLAPAALVGVHPIASSASTAQSAAVQPGHAASSSAARALWINVPFVRQVKNGCGSAVIAMVMQYWDRKQDRPDGLAADPAKIQAALFSPKAGGIYASRMRQYFENSGYRAFAFPGRWSDFERQLEKGRPLIVGLGMGGIDEPLHYLVVAGIDSERGYVFVNDPARGKMLRLSKQEFEPEWSRTQHWTLLAVPRTHH